MTRNEQVAAIRTLLSEVIAMAREAGYTGSDDDYEFTEADIDHVIECIGFKPTREAWHAAGFAWIGNGHCA